MFDLTAAADRYRTTVPWYCIRKLGSFTVAYMSKNFQGGGGGIIEL